MNKPSRFQKQPQVKAASAAAVQMRKQPVAPPVYRPQPVPRVLQRKMAIQPPPPAGQAKATPVAPPVYRPQPVPKVLQTKTAQSQPRAEHSKPNQRQPVAPPAYRPQPVPKVLQLKAAGGQRQHANQQTASGSFPPARQKTTAARQPVVQMHRSKTIQLMPVGTYVRYWDGSTAGYGKITEEKDKTYVVKVGGTETKIELGKGHVTYHPALIANGLVKSLKKLNVDENKYIFHATSATNLAHIKQSGLMPRTMVNWKQMGKEVWRGAEIATGRATDSDDPLAEHYASAEKVFQEGPEKIKGHSEMMEMLHQGDVGDFIYGTTKIDIVINYIMEIIKKGQKPVVLRFKAQKHAWYEDPKSTAVRAVGTIPATKIEKLEINVDPNKKREPRELIELEDEMDDQLRKGQWQAL